MPDSRKEATLIPSLFGFTLERILRLWLRQDDKFTEALAVTRTVVMKNSESGINNELGVFFVLEVETLGLKGSDSVRISGTMHCQTFENEKEKLLLFRIFGKD
jgi:hypothetical protein